MKKKLIASIREKELQLLKLKEHVNKSQVCSDLYDKVLMEKAVLKKQLDDLKNNNLANRIRHLIPSRKKLICDYFNG